MKLKRFVLLAALLMVAGCAPRETHDRKGREV